MGGRPIAKGDAGRSRPYRSVLSATDSPVSAKEPRGGVVAYMSDPPDMLCRAQGLLHVPDMGATVQGPLPSLPGAGGEQRIRTLADKVLVEIRLSLLVVRFGLLCRTGGRLRHTSTVVSLSDVVAETDSTIWQTPPSAINSPISVALPRVAACAMSDNGARVGLGRRRRTSATPPG